MKLLALLTAIISPVCFAEFKISPTLHLITTTTQSSSPEPSSIAYHSHDPNNSLNLQALELNLNATYNEWLSGMVTSNSFTTAQSGLESELEEAFIKLELLYGDFELRAGRYLNRFGLQNHLHLHSWSFVNANLSTPAFLGPEGLITEGAELSWIKQTDRTVFSLSTSFGTVLNAHDHSEEENHDDLGQEEHEASEEVFFREHVTSIRAQLIFNHDDFHQHRFGFNGAWGGNGFGRSSSVFSSDYTYQWREQGLEPGGRAFSTGLEFFYREAEWITQDFGLFGKNAQISFMVFGNYQFSDEWSADFRWERLQGDEPIEGLVLANDQQRTSVALTRALNLPNTTHSFTRVQYSHDSLGSRTDDTIWFQFGLSLGPNRP